MTGIVRVELDKHAGHASKTPNPHHQYAYATGSTNVLTNNKHTVRIGDTVNKPEDADDDLPSCGDPAAAGSKNVHINNIAVHRKGDATKGHDSWPANSAETGSGNVFANGE
jgi:uncharacterized Zn-binding protein involved in type VI secretion